MKRFRTQGFGMVCFFPLFIAVAPDLPKPINKPDRETPISFHDPRFENLREEEPVSEAISEVVSEADSETMEQALERLDELKTAPVNLNSRDALELERLFWLNAFQVQAILAYTQRNGPLRSIYEIAYIHGFSSFDIARMALYVQLNPISGSRVGQRKSEAKLRMDSRGRYRSTLKLLFARSSLPDLRISWVETGTPTPFLKQLSGSMQWKGKHWFKEGILGDFGMKWGQGLLVFRGIFRSSESLLTQSIQNEQVQALAQNPAYPHFRGLYLRAGFGRVSLMLGASCQDSLLGMTRLSWNNARISVGWSCLHSYSRKNVRSDSVRAEGSTVLPNGAEVSAGEPTVAFSNPKGPRSSSFQTGIEVHLRGSYMQFLAECAYRDPGLAVQTALHVFPGYRQKTGILYFSTDQADGFAYLYENEWKSLYLQLRLERTVWKQPRYRVAMPAAETNQKIILRYPFGKAQFKYQGSRRSSHTNTSPSASTTLMDANPIIFDPDPNAYAFESDPVSSQLNSNIVSTQTKAVQAFERERHRLSLTGALNAEWSGLAEYQWCRYSVNHTLRLGRALTFYVRQQDRRRKHLLSLQCTWYVSETFDAALYVSEPGLTARFSIPALHGEGLRWNGQWVYTPSPNRMYALECVYDTTWRCTLNLRIRWGS